MKLYSLALLAIVAVAQTPSQPLCPIGAACKMVNGKVAVIAQTPAPKPAPQTVTPTSQTFSIAGECHHYPMTALKPTTKIACV